MLRHLLPCTFALLLFVGSAESRKSDVRALRTQIVEGITFFEVTLDPPEDLAGFDHPSERPFGHWVEGSAGAARQLGQRPVLVSLDGNAVIYPHPDQLLRAAPKSITFFGRFTGDRKPARFRLDYSTKAKEGKGTAGIVRDHDRRSIELALDWTRAKEVSPPKEKGDRLVANDLQTQWLLGRHAHFSLLDVHSPEGGFFQFAASAQSRKQALRQHLFSLPGRQMEGRGELGELYQLLTGATALTESLALRRLANRGKSDDQRTLSVRDITGVTIGEHPWRKMMKGKRPHPELLAALVPHDNYYLTVRSLDTFVRARELLDQWGGSVMRPIQISDRDYRLIARYEKQLCLPSAELNKALKPDAVRAVALTGSDLSWQEGSDVTVLFDLADYTAFSKAHDAFIDRARKEHGKELVEKEHIHHKVAIQSFVAPQRAISLYRCRLDDVVVCSNSSAAIERVIDVSEGKAAALFDALDFQYMRTVFVRDAKKEDGFAFLSDAFIRRLVGPAWRIKAVRRLEARSRMAALSHAAVYARLDSGKLPATQGEVRRAVDLPLTELDILGGEPVRWDVARGQAISKSHGSLAFSTPLLELPIDRVTRQEKEDYDLFRGEYERLWRQFFDPVGMRFTLTEKQAVLDTYILPLINSSEYRGLRGMTGERTFEFDPKKLPAGTLGQVMLALPDLGKDFPGLGKHASLHLDDGVDLDAWIDYLIRIEVRGPREKDLDKLAELIFAAPLTLSLAVEDEKKLTDFLQTAGKELLGIAEPTESKYRGVKIRKYVLDVDKGKPLVKEVLTELNIKLPSALYRATAGGMVHLSLNEAALKKRIDSILDAKKDGTLAEANAGLLLRLPGGKPESAIRRYAEWTTNQKAMAASTNWQALHDSGWVATKDSLAKREQTAMRLWGFVPSSPDGSTFTRDATTGEIVNERHGSLTAPKIHADLAGASPLAKLFDRMRGARVELRFREDGIHTVLTLDLGGK